MVRGEDSGGIEQCLERLIVGREHGFAALVDVFGPEAKDRFERLGREGVNEIAAVYRIELNASPARQAGPRSKRHTRLALRQQVIELHQRGLLPTAIADALNVSDRRVKEVLSQAAA